MFLWKMSWRKNCPYCNSEILEVGYPMDWIQKYKCIVPDCKFNKWGKQE